MNLKRGRSFLFLGIGLAVLGVLAFIAQLWLQRLATPWYMPALALLGVAFVAASLWQQRTVWRGLALGLLCLLAGFEIVALTSMRLPAYAGPVATGRPFPTFAAALADGKQFTQADFVGDHHSVLVSFRGRW